MVSGDAGDSICRKSDGEMNDRKGMPEMDDREKTGTADQATAKLLDIEPGAACLVLNRRTWRSGQLLTAVRIWYPGTSQTLVARFTPSMPR